MKWFSSLSSKQLSSEVSPQENVPEPLTSDEESPSIPDTSCGESSDTASGTTNQTVTELPTEESSGVALHAEQEASGLEALVEESIPPQQETSIDNSEDGNIVEIKGLLQQLAKDFEIKLKYDAAKQEQIDKLYKENLNFKEGILEKFQRSLILAVIEKIDEAEKQIAFFDGKEFTEENYNKLLAFYQDTATDFQDVLLQKFDVSVFRCEPNSPFDAKRQRSLKTVPTDNPELHKVVKQSLRPGYEIDGQILRAEMVEVYVKQ